MANARFYLDEHIPTAVASGLRRRGFDVRTVVEAGMLGASDEEHFAFAHTEDRTIVTYDDDFLRLANNTSDHSGIVYATQRNDVGSLIRGLALIGRTLSPEDMQGHIEFL